MTAGCNCGRTWTGLSQAHCTGDATGNGCHQTFGSVRGFDRHRPKGRCEDPATLTTRTGEPVYRADNGPHGTTWVLHTDRVHPGQARRLAAVEDATD
jgi:hypothetical protein